MSDAPSYPKPNAKILKMRADYNKIKNNAVTSVLSICDQWIDKGLGDECFWKAWSGCPTEDILTPNMVKAALLSRRT